MMEKERFRKDKNFERRRIEKGSDGEKEKAQKEVGGDGCGAESERSTLKHNWN